MQFDSLVYLAFLSGVFLLYWQLNRVAQNWLLLAASYLFYGWWDWRFLGLIIVSSFVDYLTALGIASTGIRALRRKCLLLSIGTNLGLLGVFKYFNFFADSLARLLESVGVGHDPLLLDVVLPVGISFYTFQTMSYTIDVYRQQMKPTRDIVAFFAYVAFFPQLVAGPIERAIRLLPQFGSQRTFDAALAKDGLRQILYGLLLKTVLANTLAPRVDAVYSLSMANGWSYWLSTYAFAFQIYGDFAGYSHIAVGSARLLGFSLCRNFVYPYFSTSVAEFWSRWHTSLSTWFRDYVYIPLGGNRVSLLRHRRNILITFLLSGLWHGAALTFVVWGLIHGLFVSLHRAESRAMPDKRDVRPLRYLIPRGRELLAMVVTFHVICIGWVFFRAPSVRWAFATCKRMLLTMWTEPSLVADFRATFGTRDALETLGLIAAFMLLEWCMRSREHPLQLRAERPLLHWGVCYASAMGVLLLGHVGQIPFLYFQF